MHINKNYFIGIFTVITVLAGLVFTATVPPSIDELWSILVLLLLVYISSVGILYLLLSLIRRNNDRSNIAYALLFSCFPPVMLLLVSIKQASILDIIIIISTICLIIWYATYKK